MKTSSVSSFIIRRQDDQVRRLLANDPSLKSLKVTSSSTQAARDQLRTVAKSLQNNTHLTELSFQGNSLSLDVVLALAHSLRSNSSLLKLRLEQTELSSTAAKHLFVAVKENKTLQELHLYQNRFNEAATLELQSLLEGNTSLKVLTMKRNYVGSSLCCNSTSLEELELTECWGCAPGIQNLLQNNASLKRLYLLHAGLNYNDLVQLFQQLKQDTVIDELVITGTIFEETAAAALASCLHKNTTLTKLRLWGNRIGDKQLRTIAAGLEYNNTISELRLVQQQIGNAGALALLAALSSNTTIGTIDLSTNKIGNEAANELLELTRENANIECVEIRDNEIAKSITRNILFESRLNKALKVDGRRAIGDVSVPFSLWPFVLERVKTKPELLNFVVRQRPDLFNAMHSQHHESL